MARLGELLTTAGLITQEQLDRALRAQVVWGARLGTNLVELGAIDIETLARMLGRQHGLPSAQARHFDRADAELQHRLPTELAEQWAVVPLLYIKKEKKLAVAALEPLAADAIAQIADPLMCAPEDVLVAIAPELRIRYHLERVYQIPRSPRFMRSRKSTITPFPQFDNIPIEVDTEAEVAVPIVVDDTAHPTGRAVATPGANPDEAAALIEAAVDAVIGREDTQPIGRERRTYVRTLGEQEAPAGAIARIALRKVALTAAQATLQEALKAIRRGKNRDGVADLVMETLERYVPSCDAALLLVIRGDIAISWKCFGRSGAQAPELAVPLDRPGLVPVVVEKNVTSRSDAGQLGAIDRLLLRALGESDGDLVVVPIAIASRVVAAIATVTEAGAPCEDVEAVAGAAAAAFTRLVRDASR